MALPTNEQKSIVSSAGTVEELDWSPCGHYLRTPVEDSSPAVKAAFEAAFKDEADLIERLNRLRKLIHAVRQEAEPSIELDARRYRRLRILGAAPGESKQLEQGTVLRFTGLDAFIDADLALHASRGEYVPSGRQEAEHDDKVVTRSAVEKALQCVRAGTRKPF